MADSSVDRKAELKVDATVVCWAVQTVVMKVVEKVLMRAV